MARPDWTAKLTPALSGQLAPGETVRLSVPVDLTPGADRSDPPPRPVAPDERGVPRRAAEGSAEFLAALATGTSPVELGGAGFDQRLNGAGVTGSAGSIAQSASALWQGPSRHFVAVTDRRLIVLVEGSALRRDSGSFQVAGSIQRTQVDDVEHRPVLVNRGRVELRFVDGSMLAIQTRPQLSSAMAKDLVRAVSGRA
jgi:hypothetical protein